MDCASFPNFFLLSPRSISSWLVDGFIALCSALSNFLCFLHSHRLQKNLLLNKIVEKVMMKHPSLVIINFDQNEGPKTYDGIDICEDRCFDFIVQFVEENEITIFD